MNEKLAIGLTTEKANELLKINGKNTLEHKKKMSAPKIFAGQFRDTMVLILLAATAVSAVMGEYGDALTIMAIVVLNAILGFIQEFRTEKTLEAIKSMSAPTARVYRDGKVTTVAAENIVVGDVVSLEAGDKVPADCKVLSATATECDEAILTGESVPVAKMVSEIAPDALNQRGVVYMGTVITKGHCLAEVFATAKQTQMGKVSSLLSEIKEEQTPLQKRLSELGKAIGIICIVVCVIVSVIGVFRGYELFDMLFTGITLAVAAIPEGLPATVTIALALAVRRIYVQKALVNKLHSVETLGCTNVICTDKTGTLTLNKMTVTELYANGTHTDGICADNNVQKMLFLCGALCNNAQLTENGAVGDPTEAALLVAAKKIGADLTGYTRTNEIPFDNSVRKMEVTVKTPRGEKVTFIKGAIDAVLDKCGFILTESGIIPLTVSEKRKIAAENDKMTVKALRTLTFAYKTSKETSPVFIGIQAMRDPLRPEIKQAIKKCGTAGIKVIMLTGDHINTAREIARQAGILKEGSTVLSGAEASQMSDNELREALKTARVFARVSPSDKLRIVRALKSGGNIVAMTGDGVNDAPAVKEANIGVSMGITGMDVTKEAAKIVLLDDNFATLVNAVEQGRTIYSNIRKFIRYMLSCNIGEIFTMLFAMICGMPVVLVPIQLLLINLVTDGLPAIALSVEPTDVDIMKKPPRKPDESVFSGGMFAKILARGLSIGLLTLCSFSLTLGECGLEAARTAALITLGLSQLVFVFECKSDKATLFTARYGSNLKLIGAVLVSLLAMAAVIFIAPAASVFKAVPLPPNQLFIAILLSFAVPLLRAVWKFLTAERT